MENPIKNWWFGGFPIFLETPISFIQNRNIKIHCFSIFTRISFFYFMFAFMFTLPFKASTQLTQAKSIFAIFQVANSKSFVPQPAGGAAHANQKSPQKTPHTGSSCFFFGRQKCSCPKNLQQVIHKRIQLWLSHRSIPIRPPVKNGAPELVRWEPMCLKWVGQEPNRMEACVPGSKVAILGMVIQPLIGNPYNGYINPYYWVDDHPLLYGHIGSLDPGTCGIPTSALSLGRKSAAL